MLYPINPEISTYRSTTEGEKEDMSIHYQGHKSDIVHTLVGFNKPTGGTFKMGQAKDVITGDATVHNCYGHGNPDCSRKAFWGKDNQGVAIIPTWKPIYPVSQKQLEEIKEIKKIKFKERSNDK